MKMTIIAVAVLALLGAAAAENQCEECWGKSSGPCRHNGDWSCFDYQVGTTCPAGTTPCAPVHCEVSQWSSWGKCSEDCKGGFQTRTRKVTVSPANGGNQCPVLSETQACNTHKCPEDICVVGEWSKWGPCSATCDGGVSTRTRKVLSGFKHCPDLSETQDCNTHACKDCAGCRAKTSGPCMHDAKGDNTCFQYFSGTEQCPAGTHACVASGKSLGVLGGAPGNGLCTDCFGKSSGPCKHDAAPVCHQYMAGTTTCPPGTTLCGPVNCEVSAWSKFGKCSVSCGGGIATRTRTVTVQPANGGMACPALSEDTSCNTHACTPVCESCFGKSTGPCQHDDNSACFNYMAGTTSTCPPGSHECSPQDCVVSDWSAWSKCDASCDGGNQYRTRSVVIHPSKGGASCPTLQDNQACNTHKCPHCAGCMGKSSGPCMHDKVPVCYDYYYGTEDCPAGSTKCTVKGNSFGALGVLPGSGDCDLCFGKSAGPCRHNGDNSCHQFIAGTNACPAGTTLCAPVNCEVSAWSKWTKCSASCGGGSQSRSRSITVHPTNGGAACPSLDDTQACNTQACVPVCTECMFGTFGPCQHNNDQTCLPFFPGTSMCPPGSHECTVVDCAVTEWAAWSKCSAACGGGSRSRSRSVHTLPSPGGDPCPALSETETCNTEACSSCTGCAGKSSGPCRHNANYVCHDYYSGTTNCPAGTTECKTTGKTFGQLGGAAGNAGDGMCTECFGKSAGPCRHVKDSSCYAYMSGTTCPPGTAPCAPVDCEVSAWSAYSKCSVTCGGGSQTRTRSVTVAPTNGGMQCPHLSEDQTCNTHKCPVICEHCGGKSAGPCRHDKDGTCHQFNLGTTVCPAGTTVCENVDCEVADWSDWSKCSASCGGGSQSRTRKVLVQPSKFGQACPVLSEVQDCNTHKCSGCVGCLAKTSGPCKNTANNVCYDYYKGTSTCPAGTTECKTSGLDFSTQGGTPGTGMCSGCFGKSAGPCKHNKDSSCYGFIPGSTTCWPGTSPCAPVNCEVSAWSKWGKCSAECGGGNQQRSRTVTVAPSNGGAKCPELSQSQTCNNHKCAPACTACYKKSTGPCRHDNDGNCHQFIAGTTDCPAGTTQCEDRDCVVSEWSAWDACTVKCGGGLQGRTRSVITPQAGNGAACPALTEAQDCNTHKCAECTGCALGTSGPCQHDKDNTCAGYFPGTKVCVPGMTACSVKGTTLGIQGGAPGGGACTGCFGKSAGPCQHDKDTSCFDFMWGTTTCPPGTHACAPVNCEVSAWSKWGKCSVSCGGGGSRTRSRTVTVQPSNGGSQCPALVDTDYHCNDHPCPVNCDGCASGTSGQCQHDKDSTCFAYSTKTGSNTCPAGTTECLPVDCQVSAWSKFGKCSATCGGGSQTRTRTVTVAPAHGGAACPTLSDSQDCNTHSCGDCVGCGYGTSGPCMHNKVPVCYGYNAGTTNCPAGSTDCSTKTLATFGALGGAAGKPGNGMCTGCWGPTSGPCKHDKDTSCFAFVAGTTDCPAGTSACAPVNCEVSAWTKWGACSVNCGGGSQSRSRSVTVAPKNGGMSCPHLSEDQDCNTQACLPICNACAGKSAGTCQHDNDDTCHAKKSGSCPPGTHECAHPIDCVVSAWSKWGACDVNCGGGSRSRSRTVLVAADNGGQACPALSETEACNKQACETCAGCAGKSFGPCKNAANSVCYDYYKGTKQCPAGTSACVNTKSSFGDVSAFGGVGSGFCGGCFGKSAGPCRHVKDTSCFAYMAGTTTCPPGTAPCAPVNCEVSAWSKWGKCSTDCDGGVQSRSRSVTVAPMNGGLSCPHLSEDQACNTHKCPVRCDECGGKSAGPCRHDKDGTCHQFNAGTTTCPAGTTVCEEVDCEVSAWSKWGACDANCGGGMQQRSRSVTVQPTNGGASCPPLVDSQACNEDPCGDCAGCLGKSAGPCMHDKVAVCYGYYAGTSICPAGTTECSASGKSLGVLGGSKGSGQCTGCGGKSSGPCMNIANNVCYDFMAGGSTCPPGTAACSPSNCVVSTWSAWSKCSASCNGGSQTRSRSVLKAPSNGGAGCPALTDSQACNTHKCGASKGDSPKCGSCSGKSAGPCRHNKDNVCHDYYAGTTQCPAGTSPCVLCDACPGKTSGPCRHDKDGSCFAYQIGTTCPAGTHECSSKGNTGSGSHEVCTGCWPGTSGPCQQSNTVCHGYFPGTKTCPGGTYECSKTGSFAAKPLVVFDVKIQGEVNEDSFSNAVASAASVPASAVVIESVSVQDDGSTNVGFVVVSEDPSATEVAVSSALSTNQVAAGFAGMNKPAEMSVGAAGVTSGAGVGMSSTAIALIACGAFVAVVVALAAVVYRKKKSGHVFLRQTSSKVMQINIPSAASSPRVSPNVARAGRSLSDDSDDE